MITLFAIDTHGESVSKMNYLLNDSMDAGESFSKEQKALNGATSKIVWCGGSLFHIKHKEM